MIVGLWKLGYDLICHDDLTPPATATADPDFIFELLHRFPETTMYFYKAVVAHPKPTTLVFWSDILNGVGLALHHSAASLCICMLTCGAITPSREVIETTIPLVVQHW